jgi:putative DNA primase/helicase
MMNRISIREVAAALGGEPIGRNSCNVPGPHHSRKDRSLTVTLARDGRVIVHSHAGDDWKACRDYVFDKLGLERESRPQHRPTPWVVVHPTSSEDDSKRKAIALRIWGQSVSPMGTLVERYLKEHRGLKLGSDVAGNVIRYHGSLYFDEFSRKPGMVCLMRNIVTDEPCGIHRTFLDRETAAKVDRRMLGIAKGSAVKLDPHQPTYTNLTVGEGIETGLAAREAGLGPVWALGSTSGITSFPVVKGAREITLLQENDVASRRAITACGRRYLAAGKPVNLVTPEIGNDFNDVWKAVRA